MIITTKSIIAGFNKKKVNIIEQLTELIESIQAIANQISLLKMGIKETLSHIQLTKYEEEKLECELRTLEIKYNTLIKAKNQIKDSVESWKKEGK